MKRRQADRGEPPLLSIAKGGSKMARSKTSLSVLALFVAPLLALVVSACGGGGEEQALIRAYFQAARFNDRQSLANIAMYAWDPSERGSVSSPDVESVAEEQRRPLLMKDLSQTLADALQADEEFTAEKVAYQDENMEAIQRVLDAEAEEEDVRRADQEIQEAWTDWRDRTMEHTGAVSEARSALGAEQGEAELSMYDANNPLDVSQYNGELITKEVVVIADVELDGAESEQTLTVTLQQAVLTGDDGMPMEGRWVIRSIT